MLSALLTALQTSLTSSKPFLLGNLLPALLFLAANAGVGYLALPDARAWWQGVDGSGKVLAGTVSGAVALGVAVLLSLVTGPLLEALEGKYRWPLVGDALARVLTTAQSRRLERLERDGMADQIAGRTLRHEAARLDWETRLRQALAAACALQRGAAGPAAAPGEHPLDGARREVRDVIGDVRRARLAGARISAAQIEAAVLGVERLLRRYNPESDHQVDAAQAEVLLAMSYARDKYQVERVRRFNQRQFSYPGVPDDGRHAQPANVLAPTALGNIGGTMRSYALSRYGMDLDILWTRLQHVIQQSDKPFGVLQDAKAQLDCCVTLSWLSAVFAAAWAPTLLWVGRDARLFALVGIAGPLVSVAWYRLACARYRVFADLLRSAVDLFRFDLLRALAIPLPAGPDEERRIWIALSQQTGYDEHMDVSYQHAGAK